MSSYIDYDSLDTIEKACAAVRTLTTGEAWVMTPKEMDSVNAEIRKVLAAFMRVADVLEKVKARKRDDDQQAAEEPSDDKSEWLVCVCCGSNTRGRQWWNRAKGYGLCDDCIDANGVDGVPMGEMAIEFGVRGYHWDIKGVTYGSELNVGSVPGVRGDGRPEGAVAGADQGHGPDGVP